MEVEGWENGRGEAGGDGRLGMGQTVNDHFLFKRVKSWVWLGLGKGLGPSLLFWILRIWIKRCKWIRFVFLAQGPML